MSSSRRKAPKSKSRRERTPRPASADTGAMPELLHPFATERHMREVQAMLEGQKFHSVDEVNARLAELTRGGRLSEAANAWKRDDPQWRAQELAYEAMETDGIVEALRLVNEALALDPDCTDAQRLMVALLPMEPGNRIELMSEAVERAERKMDEEFLRENTGHFWGIVSTRPYMRARQHLGELLAEAGRLEEAIPVLERMLELNRNDNQGMRYPLLGLYLAAGRPKDASRLMEQFADEERIMGSFAWARVLERWLSGEPSEADAALENARKVNPFAERYLSGAQELPRETPAWYRPGEENEAQVCARELGPAWQGNPQFREWLCAKSPDRSKIRG